MENASKALLLAGGVLIGLIVISIGVYLFNSYRENAISYNKQMQATEIRKFNVNFTNFEGRTDITIHEIITLTNFAIQHKKETGIHVTISILEPGNQDLVSTCDSVELIKNNSEDNFKCSEINDKDKDGKIDFISFERIKKTTKNVAYCN